MCKMCQDGFDFPKFDHIIICPYVPTQTKFSELHGAGFLQVAQRQHVSPLFFCG